MRYTRETLRDAGRAVYNDRALRAFWCFFIVVAVVTFLSN